MGVIKTFSEFINESIWSDMQDRSAGDKIRKEDEKTNINDIVPLDMGVDVLWADRDLEWRNGGFFFTYNEVKKLALSAAFNTRDEMYYTSFGIDEKDVIVGWSVLSSTLGIPNSDVDARENVSESVAADYIVNVVEMLLKQEIAGDTLKDKALSLELDYTDKLLKKSKYQFYG